MYSKNKIFLDKSDMYIERTNKLWIVYVDNKKKYTLSTSLSESEAWKMAKLLLREELTKDVVC